MTIIIGCGYIGHRLAAALDDVSSVVVRSESSAEKLRQAGYKAYAIDFDQDITEFPDMTGQDVYYLMPPPTSGKEDTRMAQFVQACRIYGHPRRIVYISTTSVYGDCQGAWIDEDAPIQLKTDRSLRRYDAETLLQQWAIHSTNSLVILRVAGIYGIDKLPLARLKKKLPIIVENEAPYTNRIYAEDLVTLCQLAMKNGRTREVYLACDGKPGNMTDYFNQVADATGLPRPEQISRAEAEKTLSLGMLSYLNESRRLRNDKIKQQLGMVFQYPDLASGLAHAVENSSNIVNNK